YKKVSLMILKYFRKYLTLIVFLLSQISFAPVSFSETLEVKSFPREAVQFERVTVSMDLPYCAVNPYEASSVTVDLRIIDPDNVEIVLPCFCLHNSRQDNRSSWEARFTPVKPGNYKFYAELKTKSVKKKSGYYNFYINKGNKDGFLRQCEKNPYYLKFDSGKTFFGIGHNIAWVDGGSLSLFERYFSNLAEGGCNLARVWLCEWSIPVESDKLCEYNKDAGERLDKLIDLARDKNIRVILCLDTYGSLMTDNGAWAEERWSSNPYNKKNGGPCADPEDFFTDSEAKRIYKNKLRYIVSRWGYSPNIMAFELWNEYNAPAVWVKEMSRFMKSVNPHPQFITTSMGYPYGEIFDAGEVWRLDDVDIISEHIYGNKITNHIILRGIQKAREFAALYSKPFIFAETGIDAGKDDKFYDPEGEGTALHNSIWSSALSKSMGTSLHWWWDSYIRPKKLYGHYLALKSFLDGVKWDSGNIKYADTGLLKYPETSARKRDYRDVEIKPIDKWGRVYTRDFTVLNNGDIIEGFPSRYLHGELKDPSHDGQTYRVDYPRAGKFIIKVGVVSQGARLEAYIDGVKVLERDFPAGEGDGPWSGVCTGKMKKFTSAFITPMWRLMSRRGNIRCGF
ncbi:MAG: cellulase family glycosylhydrolase, partial [Candidatus Omnitrophota bacterium]